MKTSTILATILLVLSGCENELPRSVLPVGGQPPEGTVGDVDGDDDPQNDPGGGEGPFSGGPDNTFDHMDDLGDGATDPFEILAQRQEEGPPEIRTRLHSCQKPQIAAIRNILLGFGVSLEATGNPAPAGELFQNGRDALGASSYASRTPEAIVWTNSGATKLQDIFAMAAPEIIAAMPSLTHCQEDGQPTTMFDEQDRCNEAAVTCLLGRPATPAHLAICNEIVESGSTPEAGKAIAVATLLSAAHTCE
jgi:hypothetical protein